jgi:hypothetical protein
MSRGTAPHVPPDDHSIFSHPPHPNYSVTTTEWREPPVFSTKIPRDNAFYTNKLSQDDIYRTFGDPSIWNSYIIFGYYAYKDCIEFASQWEILGKKSELEINWFIWMTYRFYYENNIIPDGKLVLWAKKIAKPFLEIHNPTAVSSTISGDLRTLLSDYIDQDQPITEYEKFMPIDKPFLLVTNKKQKNKKNTTPTRLNKNTSNLVSIEETPCHDEEPADPEQGTKRSNDRQVKSPENHELKPTPTTITPPMSL